MINNHREPHTPPTEDWITPKAKVRGDSISGKGLFAIDPIKQGEKVLQWGGMYVGKEEAEQAREQGRLVMQFDEDLFSVEDARESDAYFLNHACNPNIWMQDAFTFAARRDIKAGEEITADYALFEAREELFPNGSVAVALLTVEDASRAKIGESKNCKKSTKSTSAP